VRVGAVAAGAGARPAWADAVMWVRGGRKEEGEGRKKGEEKKEGKRKRRKEEKKKKKRDKEIGK
jgi:hypothetical protein